MNEAETKDDTLAAREDYIEAMKAALLGPGSEFSVPDAKHELISVAPSKRYSTGILFPQNDYIELDEIEETPAAENADGVQLSFEETHAESSKKTGGDTSTAQFSSTSEESVSENLDEEINMAAQYKPSSMGLTFLVRGNSENVHASIEFATYRKATTADCKIPFTPDSPEDYTVPDELNYLLEFDSSEELLRLKKQIDRKEVKEVVNQDAVTGDETAALRDYLYVFADCCTNGYVREPHEIPDFIVDFANGDYFESDSLNVGSSNAEIKVVALREKLDGNAAVWAITIMLVNESKDPHAGHPIFQPQIEVNTSNNSFTFVESATATDFDSMTDEERSLELLYRNKHSYGTGLGTSVDWDIGDIGTGSIKTEFFPVVEVPTSEFSLPDDSQIERRKLSMKYLSDLDPSTREEKLSGLKDLVNLYANWASSLEETIGGLDEKYRPTARTNISQCYQACERMRRGIDILGDNDEVYKAFLLANRAMFMQRVHTIKQAAMAEENADRYPGDEEISEWLGSLDYREEPDDDCIWRPFQIAFLLMDIRSIVEEDSPERDIVDLIWFPTGGGKTEAYLGLTAFTIFYRKLNYLERSNGTAVIMRYTLRLLATQQFNRAAALICACEYIRQDCAAPNPRYPDYPLGKDPITIGLWIGGAHIPNRNDEAKTDLDDLRKAGAWSLDFEKERHNKFQVLKCPWCGTKMVKDNENGKLVGEWGYKQEERGNHFYMACPNEDCDFAVRLPIQIIDEELYRNPPTLLFGTVDKFAMLPWDGRTGVFFGEGNNRTPELIIQDELHLISGALGTIVGLYESAVDALCEEDGVAPKIIASTATIRKAQEQCSALYNRKVMQFPPPGLDAEDSFFSRDAKIDYENRKFGRKYIGIMPSGQGKTTLEVAIIANCLQKSAELNFSDEVKDKYWTLTSYFNSLRDLGRASTLVQDEIQNYMMRHFRGPNHKRRYIPQADELTSRVTMTELNSTLDKLEKIEYSEANRVDKKYASNILLATNMISVGIDIPRLNIMHMVGQPKLTSEYIQASSRVGRSYPGIVLVQYDAGKSRDRSHYEQFRSYHESFYRYVEPTGATPFSKPARQRALHAVLLSILRQREGLESDEDAQCFDMDTYNNQIQAIEDFLIDRISSIGAHSKGQFSEDPSEIRSEMKGFFEAWQDMVQECGLEEDEKKLYFGRRFMFKKLDEDSARLLKTYEDRRKDSAFRTLTSMRNVDATVQGEVVIWSSDNE